MGPRWGTVFNATAGETGSMVTVRSRPYLLPLERKAVECMIGPGKTQRPTTARRIPMPTQRGPCRHERGGVLGDAEDTQLRNTDLARENGLQESGARDRRQDAATAGRTQQDKEHHAPRRVFPAHRDADLGPLEKEACLPRRRRKGVQRNGCRGRRDSRQTISARGSSSSRSRRRETSSGTRTSTWVGTRCPTGRATRPL